MLSDIIIEPLNKNHDKSNFCCGEESLDIYLKQYASQDDKRQIAKIFVAQQNNQVTGFYSLNALSVLRETMPENIAKKLPKYPVPSGLLGRLSIDKSMQGKGLGAALLINAMKRVLNASEDIAIYALFADAKNQLAKDFYLKYGFIELPNQNMRLFLSLDTIKSLLNQK